MLAIDDLAADRALKTSSDKLKQLNHQAKCMTVLQSSGSVLNKVHLDVKQFQAYN